MSGEGILQRFTFIFKKDGGSDKHTRIAHVNLNNPKYKLPRDCRFVTTAVQSIISMCKDEHQLFNGNIVEQYEEASGKASVNRDDNGKLYYDMYHRLVVCKYDGQPPSGEESNVFWFTPVPSKGLTLICKKHINLS